MPLTAALKLLRHPASVARASQRPRGTCPPKSAAGATGPHCSSGTPRTLPTPPVHHLPYRRKACRGKGRWPLMSEPEIPQESNEVSDSWQQMVQAVLGVVLLAGAVAMFHYYAPAAEPAPQPDELHKQVQHTT